MSENVHQQLSSGEMLKQTIASQVFDKTMMSRLRFLLEAGNYTNDVKLPPITSEQISGMHRAITNDLADKQRGSQPRLLQSSRWTIVGTLYERARASAGDLIPRVTPIHELYAQRLMFMQGALANFVMNLPIAEVDGEDIGPTTVDVPLPCLVFLQPSTKRYLHVPLAHPDTFTEDYDFRQDT